jgi:hemolysin III
MAAVVALLRNSFDIPADYEQRVYFYDSLVLIGTVVLAVIGALALTAMAMTQPDMERALALMIYGISVVLTQSLSASYNLNRELKWVERLRACDHAGIFAMIGGTYTPLAVMGLGGTEGAVVLAFIWTAAAVGAFLKLNCPRRYERCGIAAYLILGWMILPMLWPLSMTLPAEALWMLAGGCAIYSIGVYFHLARRIPYHNVIWHACVLAGAACHFIMMVVYVANVPRGA